MQLRYYLGIEFLILFVLLPISFTFDYHIGIKAGLVLSGLVYIFYKLIKDPAKPLRLHSKRNWKPFLKRIGIQFLVVGLVTALYVYYVAPEHLFCVPRSNPLLFIQILGIYTFLSVWPQEVIYRTFFFVRYEHLFNSKALLILVNAVIFSLAHIIFQNTLVTVLTLVGGLLFAYTYYKTRSTFFVSLEHAIYGNWLFTVGMGEMLAFPGMGAC